MYPKGTTFNLEITCNGCRTVLTIPHDKFRAGFAFDKPYPKQKSVKPTTEQFEKKDAEADNFIQDVLGIKLGEKKEDPVVKGNPETPDA